VRVCSCWRDDVGGRSVDHRASLEEPEEEEMHGVLAVGRKAGKERRGRRSRRGREGKGMSRSCAERGKESWLLRKSRFCLRKRNRREERKKEERSFSMESRENSQ